MMRRHQNLERANDLVMRWHASRGGRTAARLQRHRPIRHGLDDRPRIRIVTTIPVLPVESGVHDSADLITARLPRVAERVEHEIRLALGPAGALALVRRAGNHPRAVPLVETDARTV